MNSKVLADNNNNNNNQYLSNFAMEMEEKIVFTIAQESFHKNLGFYQVQSDLKMSEELNKIVPKKLQRGKVLLRQSCFLFPPYFFFLSTIFFFSSIFFFFFFFGES